jgi:hypothetical protein
VIVDEHKGEGNGTGEHGFDEDLRAPAPIDDVHRTMLERMKIQERWREQMNSWRIDHDRWRLGIDTRVDKLDAHLTEQDGLAAASSTEVKNNFTEINQKLNLLLTERTNRNWRNEFITKISQYAWKVIALVFFVLWTVGTFFYDHWPLKAR